MHWVKATAPDGRENWINLAAVQTMMRGADATMLFLGGITTIAAPTGAAKFHYASTSTRETPDELFALPRVLVNEAPAIPLESTADILPLNPPKPAKPVKTKALRKKRNVRL